MATRIYGPKTQAGFKRRFLIVVVLHIHIYSTRRTQNLFLVTLNANISQTI